MPVRNSSSFLTETLESIINQTFQNWELIAIDDHSSDSTWDLLCDFQRKDQRIKVLRNQGSGIIDALTQGEKYAHGEYLSRFDADDIMPKRRLQMMIDELEKSDQRTVVTGLVQYFSTDTVSEGYRKYERWINQNNMAGTQWDNIYRECVIASPNWLMRKTELDLIGGMQQLQYPEDYDLVFRWYKNGFKIKTVNALTLAWREHPARTSRNSSHYDQKSFFNLKISRFLQIDYDQKRPLILWGAGIKTKLTVEVLLKQKVSFTQQNLRNYVEIAQFENPQLLICIYPDENTQEKINAYLQSLKMIEGKDWWYL